MCGFCVERMALDLSVCEDAGNLGIDMLIQEEVDPGCAIAVAVEHGFEETPAALARMAEAVINGLPVAARHREMVTAALSESQPRLLSALYPQVDKTALFEAAGDYLDEFSNWWFGGGVVEREIEMVNGVFDPITSISMSDFEQLRAMTPATMASLAALRRYGAPDPKGESLLFNIVANAPPGVPDFDGCDLWIQRRAILDLFDRYGVEGMLRRATDIRPFLWVYLMKKRDVSKKVCLTLDATFGEKWQEYLS